MKKIFVALMAVAFIGLWAYALTMPRSDTPSSPLVGQSAPVFTLSKLAGGERVLTELRGKPIILNFWASWCTVCRVEAKMLQAAHMELRDSGLAVVGVAIRDDADAARQFAEEYGKTYELLIDPEGTVAVDYGVYGVPETFFIDALGVIQFRIVGEVTPALLQEGLQKVGFAATGAM